MTRKQAGAIGGQAKVPKGFAALSPEERKRVSKKAAKARWKKNGKGEMK